VIAVVGELAGARLAYYPPQTMAWRDWQAAYPDSEVMSRFTGYQREYEGFPYASYFESDDVWFEVAAESPQLFAKEPVVGVELPGEAFVAYLETDLAAVGALNDTAGGIPLVVAAGSDSGTLVSVFDRRVGPRELTFALEGDRQRARTPACAAPVLVRLGCVSYRHAVAPAGRLSGAA
jgi:hypothetical protein